MPIIWFKGGIYKQILNVPTGWHKVMCGKPYFSRIKVMLVQFVDAAL